MVEPILSHCGSKTANRASLFARVEERSKSIDMRLRKPPAVKGISSYYISRGKWVNICADKAGRNLYLGKSTDACHDIEALRHLKELFRLKT